MGSPDVDARDQISILLVDDKPENLIALEAVLSRPEYRLVKALSGKEALRRLLEQDFALILLDVQMPEMDGFETATLIRGREKSRNIPIIFVTAIYQNLLHVKSGYAAGAVDYLLKPFDPEILRSKVAVFAQLYRQRMEIQRQAEIICHEQRERAAVEAMNLHYRDLVNWLDHSIIWEAIAPEMRFSLVSKRAVELLGYPHERWFDEPDFFLKCIPGEEREGVRRMFERALERGSEERGEHRMIAADGRLMWFHTGIQVERRRGDSRPLFRGLTVDISPLKEIEQDLRRREARFRRVVDANLVGHIFCDLQGRISDANHCFLEMVGYSRDELAAGSLRWDAMTPLEHREGDERAMLELRDTGVCTPYEKEFICKDGRRIPVMIGVALLEGSEQECIAFALDLTERKEAEEQKSRAIRAREALLEVVSHDLKNPLGAILLNAALLFRKLPSDPDTQSVRKQLEAIQRSAQRMKNLIEDLLDLAKVEAGRLKVVRARQRLEPILEEVIDMFRSDALEKDLTLEKEVVGETEEVSCDRERILQVFANLIGNAVKFTPDHGTIRVRAELTGREARISVKDTGHGIPVQALPHVFDRFWQGNATGKQGTGLGLSIAKGIVEAHGGRIWAESQENYGTTFFFTLPEAGTGESARA